MLATFFAAGAALACATLPFLAGRAGAVVGLVLVLAATVHFFDWRMMRSPRAAAESAALVAWLAQDTRRRRWTWIIAVCCVAAGGIQLALQASAGGRTPFLAAYGIVISSLRDGEAWRLFVGFFWHANFVHWLQNAIAVTLLLPAAIRIFGASWTWSAFVSGMLAGALVLPIIDPAAKAIMGISGGVHAVAALVLVSVSLAPRRWPTGPVVTLSCVVAADYLLTSLLSTGSLVLHGAGSVIGAVFGLAYTARLHGGSSRSLLNTRILRFADRSP
jgi:membrane associated rhomboid family serine protease